MRRIPLIDDEAELIQLYAEIEQRAAEAQTVRPVWPCKKGCDGCCRRLAHPPEITAVEWDYLFAGIRALPEPIQAEIGKKIEALENRDEGKRPFVVCPLLDEETGACRVYDYRPAACRMYGFYVSRHNNQWCQQIEDLFEAGALDGAVLGNYAAMNRQIRRMFGDVESIVVWWGEEMAVKG